MIWYSLTYRDENPQDGVPVPHVELKTGLALYNLRADPGEQFDVSADHPDIVERLSRKGDDFNRNMEKHARPIGRVQQKLIESN